ncbi:hypothetical protein [Streptomyces phaeochromogenes]|uniref:Uncharacterized protein n=1 Tax=Streptomyces phaeochromogenes TaxID=1923 RepID=A0ABZ1H1A9_STRPH|nr:hypothetical protein [Streptomyces phaeochromogenes]WRZ26751.1 hypothetical protein OG931_02930 [Streptomyces phaeochromogenes]WSD12316.1 hypothetical protein OHB35_03320 [Streptomyces phaeochromogenes]WSJ10882.1 hypothetical protein OG437_48195 [Streptomyces phaeochromogenes]
MALWGDSVPAPELLDRAHYFGRLGALSAVMAARFQFPIQVKVKVSIQVKVQSVGSGGAVNLIGRMRSSCGSDR